MKFEDSKIQSLKVYFREKSFPVNISNHTTCSEVVHMVLVNAGVVEVKHVSFAVFERTSGLDRMLPGNARVLRTWKSWGSEASNVKFVIQRKTTALSLKKSLSDTKMSCADEESTIDGLFTQKYKRGNNALNTSDDDCWSSALTDPAVVEDIHNHHCMDLGNMAFTLNKTEDSKKKTSDNKQKPKQNGKRALLARYLSDIMFHGKRKQKKSRLPTRERGDGADDSVLSDHCQGDGVENKVVNCTTKEEKSIRRQSNLREKCKYYWNKNYLSDSDSDSDIDSDVTDLSDDSFTCDRTTSINLDTAFVKSSRDSDSDEGIDVTSNYSGDLNTAFNGEFEILKCGDVSLKSDFDSEEIRHFGQNKLDRNITNNGFVKQLFGYDVDATILSQDEEMDSFMITRLESP